MSFDSEPWDATCEAEGTSTHDTCATEALILTLTLTLTLALTLTLTLTLTLVP